MNSYVKTTICLCSALFLSVSAQSDLTKLVIANGKDSDSVVNRLEVEVIDLASSDDRPCSNPPPAFDYPVQSAVGTFIDGRPTICGNYPVDYACFRYDNETDTWEQDLFMVHARGHAGHVMLSDSEWLIGGGFTEAGNAFTNTMESYRDGAFLPYSTSLPAGFTDLLLVSIDNNRFAFLGRTSTYIYDKKTAVWSNVGRTPSFNHNFFFAGVVEKKDGTLELVKVGGDTQFATNVAILNLSTMEWRTGNSQLPEPLYQGVSVPYDRTFLLVGGYNYQNNRYSDKIYKYQPEDEDFIELQYTIQYPRKVHSAFLVPGDYFECE